MDPTTLGLLAGGSGASLLGSIGNALFGKSSASRAGKALMTEITAAQKIINDAFKANMEEMQPFLEFAKEQVPYQREAFAKYYSQVMGDFPKFQESEIYKDLQGMVEAHAGQLARAGAATGAGAGTLGKALSRYSVPLFGQAQEQFFRQEMLKREELGGLATPTQFQENILGKAIGARESWSTRAAELQAQYGEARAQKILGEYQAMQPIFSAVSNIGQAGLGAGLDKLIGK